MNLMQRAQAWWADVFAEEDGPLDGDAPIEKLIESFTAIAMGGLVRSQA